MYKSAAYQQGYYDAYVKYAGIGEFLARMGGGLKKLVTMKPAELSLMKPRDLSLIERMEALKELDKVPSKSTLQTLAEAFRQKKIM